MRKDNTIFNLLIIPLLHTYNNEVVKTGQVCRMNSCSLEFLTGLSWKNKIYSNIQNEPPLNKTDLYTKGRTNALIGYGCGRHEFKYTNGATKWKPDTILRFLDTLECCNAIPPAGLDPMPVIYKRGGCEEMFNLETKAKEYFSKVDGLELLTDVKECCKWAGKSYLKYRYRLMRACKNMYLGWSTGGIDTTVSHKGDKDKLYNVFTAGWNQDNILAILNSRINNIV